MGAAVEPKLDFSRAEPGRHDEVVKNLLELYYYDFAEILKYEIGADGSYLAAFEWSDDEPLFLLYADGLPAGFAILSPGSRIDGRQDVWDVKEFFVIRRHRRSGLGSWLARQVWREHPGTWDVRVVEPNTGALAFWRRAVAEAAGAPVEPSFVTLPAPRSSVFLFRFETRTEPDRAGRP